MPQVIYIAGWRVGILVGISLIVLILDNDADGIAVEKFRGAVDIYVLHSACSSNNRKNVWCFMSPESK